MTATLRVHEPAGLDFADLPPTDRTIAFDDIDFMRLAEIAHEAILRMNRTTPPPGVTKEQMAAMAITQLFTEQLEEIACEA